MWFNRKIRVRQKYIEQYRQDLISGLEIAPTEEHSLYKIHLESLNRLENLLKSSCNVEEITELVRSERHAHGWSFLSGEAGEKATSSAHVLLSDLERQIFRLKGKDWYYSDEWRRQ